MQGWVGTLLCRRGWASGSNDTMRFDDNDDEDEAEIRDCKLFQVQVQVQVKISHLRTSKASIFRISSVLHFQPHQGGQSVLSNNEDRRIPLLM
jgi:hypothetical protein